MDALKVGVQPTTSVYELERMVYTGTKFDSEVFPYCLDLFRAQYVVRSNGGKMRQAEKIMDV